MGVLDVVESVLKEAGTPLHNTEITKRVLATGLWQISGKTPDATINAQLAVHIKKRGNDSRFVRAGPGIFALRSTHASPRSAAPAQAAAPAVSKSAGAQHLSFTDAAEKVLTELGGKKPMHYRAIAEKALDLGLVKTTGKTPEATLYARYSPRYSAGRSVGNAAGLSRTARGMSASRNGWRQD